MFSIRYCTNLNFNTTSSYLIVLFFVSLLIRLNLKLPPAQLLLWRTLAAAAAFSNPRCSSQIELSSPRWPDLCPSRSSYRFRRYELWTLNAATLGESSDERAAMSEATSCFETGLHTTSHHPWFQLIANSILPPRRLRTLYFGGKIFFRTCAIFHHRSRLQWAVIVKGEQWCWKWWRMWDRKRDLGPSYDVLD